MTVTTRTAAMLLYLSAALLFCATAYAGPSANRIKEGPGLFDGLFSNADKSTDNKSEPQKPMADEPQKTSETLKNIAYDGVWDSSNGRLLFIKKIHRTLFLSGSNHHAAWQAQCIITNTLVKCIGNGISNTDGEFSYESDLNLNTPNLQSDWKFNYKNGHSNSGHTSHQKIH